MEEQTMPAAQLKVPRRPPAIEPKRVHEFVGVVHGDLEPVKTLLAQKSGLLNAAWD